MPIITSVLKKHKKYLKTFAFNSHKMYHLSITRRTGVQKWHLMDLHSPDLGMNLPIL